MIVPLTTLDLSELTQWAKDAAAVDWAGVWRTVLRGDLRSSAFAEFGMNDNRFPLMNRWIPLTCILLYLLLVLRCSPKDNKGPRTGGTALKCFSVFHNLFMTFYSFMTFYYTLPIVIEGFGLGYSVRDTLCVSGMKHWDILGFWSWLFYLSKIYEFVDTLLIILKNRRPSVLQYFHHAGAVFVMWSLVAARHPGIMVFVTFNSFIHSLMYGYYFFTTLHLSFLKPVLNAFKPLMTLLQILQFVVGVSCTSGVNSILLCSDDPELRMAHEVAVSLTHLYVFLLVGLFSSFAYDTYVKPKKKVKSL